MNDQVKKLEKEQQNEPHTQREESDKDKSGIS